MTDPDAAALRRILRETRTIALVGASANPARPSHDVGVYLVRAGYRVIGVNPGLEGRVLFGRPVVARLADVPGDVEMVDVFRRSEAVAQIAREALARWPRLPVLWLQLGIVSAEARALAEAAGTVVVEDRCTKIEHARLVARGA
ncbi:CoA-binding protein [Histidinibacterium lentulum]|nr:CoA-binding protein [Histidinibacterium lentulum]